MRSIVVPLLAIASTGLVSSFQETFELKYVGEVDPELINNNAKTMFMNKAQYERNGMPDGPPTLASQATVYLGSEFLAIVHPPSQRSLTDNLESITADCTGRLDCRLSNYVVREGRLSFDVELSFTERRLVPAEALERDEDGFLPLGMGITADITVEIFAEEGVGEPALKDCIPVISRILKIQNPQTTVSEIRRRKRTQYYDDNGDDGARRNADEL